MKWIIAILLFFNGHPWFALAVVALIDEK